MTPKFIPGSDIDQRALAHRRALGFSDDQIIDGMTLITKLKEKYSNFDYIRVADGALNSAEAQWDDVKKRISLPESVFQPT
ncbi:MAG: hypothetical protein ABIO35_04980 [Nitrobacter sp.]